MRRFKFFAGIVGLMILTLLAIIGALQLAQSVADKVNATPVPAPTAAPTPPPIPSRVSIAKGMCLHAGKAVTIDSDENVILEVNGALSHADEDGRRTFITGAQCSLLEKK